MGHDEDESYLTFLGLVVLKDDLREEALKGVELIQNAGIQVVMITGMRKIRLLRLPKRLVLLRIVVISC